jgi:hypothetical protein
VKQQKDPHSAHYEGRSGIRAVTFHPEYIRDDVIAHEIFHFMQDKRNHADGWVTGERPPNGEKSCDVYVCARHKELARVYSSYLDIDYRDMKLAFTEDEARLLLHVLAKQALILRKQGERRYIRHMELAVNEEIKTRLKLELERERIRLDSKAGVPDVS